MPDLPRIFAKPNLPDAPGLPRATPDSFGVGAWNSFGRAADVLADTFNKIEDASVEAESRRRIQETQAQIEDAIKQGDMNEVDPDTYHKNTWEAVQGIHARNREDIKNHRVIEKYDNALSPFMIRSRTAVDTDRQKKKVLAAEADFAAYLDGATMRLSKMDAADPKRKDLEKEIVGAVNDAVRTQTIKPKDGVNAVIKIRDEADKERMAWKILTDPEGLLAILKDPNELPTVQGSARVAAEQRALEALRERRIAGEKKDQERLNKMTDDLLVESTAPNANLSAIRERVRNMKDDSPKFSEFRRFWLDRLDQRINAQGTGDADPFFKSDGQVYSHVLRGVMNEPEKWGQQDIDRYIGRGLSVTHGKELKTMLEKAHKGEADNGPLKEVHGSWERMRRGGFFLPKDKRVYKNGRWDPTQQEMLRNDAAAQEVWDQVLADAKKGVPIAQAFQTRMQPFHDAEVKGFFSSLAETFLPPFMRSAPGTTQKDETDAIQFLQRTKQPITQKNIDSYIQQKKTGGAPTSPTQPAGNPPGGPGSAAMGALQGGTAPKQEFKLEGGMLKHEGGDWDIRQMSTIQDWFTNQFGKPLPVTAQGNTATHARMGYDHAKSVDVGINPSTPEGFALIEYLLNNKIPFIAFDRAIPGQATGPHIHIGKPSPRVAQR